MSPGPAVPEALRNAALLVVDDAPTKRALVSAHLRRAGFHNITLAEDGLQALEALGQASFDLVLLDILMPGLDGFETCRALRRDPRWAELPVLAMTGLEESEERAEIFAAGATDLILKPIHQAELIARMVSHLHNRQLIRGLRDFAERTNAELAAARQMQEALLPGPALLAEMEARYGLRVASRFLPSAELAGDLWGLWPLDGARFGLFALDVVGHGTIAAINAFRLHTLFAQDRSARDEPGLFLEGLNRRLRPLFSTGQFATMFYAVLDVARDAIAYAAAGYTSPVLAGRGGTRLLDGSGLPLGISGSARYETRQATWRQGEALLLYSDALSEATTACGSLLGEEGVRDLCGAAFASGNGAHGMADALAQAASGAHGPADDLTLVCLLR
ncbi:fused response regulator/phosphatase [Roseomonas sp. GC11]|uniref:PP2C family protein-serine/threonine phosphatase n=1 Tax=Roseomonas sp. GC11 TaxID=2950546 RepID=UPI00210EBB7C|nr:fused response regulator/phosphatase [Roseomonas sp. GC11]MCQ4162585.1 fused response regulator/phosphatase [Roseomonas sp. GC11]